MTSYLVLTVIGDDKPGLVESLASTVANHGGNWLESSMSQLAGKFAGVLRVSVSEQDADGLCEALQGLSDRLQLVIERVPGGTEEESPQTLSLTLVGNDRPGIVHEISRVLAAQAVNVEQLSSECVPAPMSGGMLFKARARLKVSQGLALDALQAELEQLADDLIVELKSP